MSKVVKESGIVRRKTKTMEKQHILYSFYRKSNLLCHDFDIKNI